MQIFDVHVHVYPDKIALKAAQSIGEFYNGTEIHGSGTLADCLQRMDAAGTTRFAAHSVALTPHNVGKINRFILSAHEQAPERIVPFAAIHPDVADMQLTVDGIVEQGFRGFKIHPDMQRFAVDDAHAAPMMEAIEGSGLPLLIHCGDNRYDFDGPRRILRLHQEHPGLRIIAAHFGGWLEWDDAVELLAGRDLVVDLSSSLYQWSSERGVQAVRSFGAENVLYGTDYPMWDPAEELQRFMKLDLTDAEREDILWNNAARLLKL